MRFPDARLLVFARAPVPGRCKTRLIPAIGPRRAARVQRELLEKSLELTVASGLAQVELWCAPNCSHPAFSRMRSDYGASLHRQAHGDLGRRMSEALRRALRRARYAVLIGTDCPALTSRDLRTALDALKNGADFVFQPAEDGGYVLVGARRVEPRLFRNIRWSSSQVMPATRRRLARVRASAAELPRLWDVDEPADLRRALRESLLA
jgi:rSAM/selenodomain-associated transferase 1